MCVCTLLDYLMIRKLWRPNLRVTCPGESLHQGSSRPRHHHPELSPCNRCCTHNAMSAKVVILMGGPSKGTRCVLSHPQVDITSVAFAYSSYIGFVLCHSTCPSLCFLWLVFILNLFRWIPHDYSILWKISTDSDNRIPCDILPCEGCQPNTTY